MVVKGSSGSQCVIELKLTMYTQPKDVNGIAIPIHYNRNLNHKYSILDHTFAYSTIPIREYS